MARTLEPSLQAFRGIAILCIVAVHGFGFSFWDATQVAEPNPVVVHLTYLNEVLFHGATLFFTLISGLLYSIALSGQTWPRFFRAKLYHVALPYLLFTVLFTWINFLNPEGLLYSQSLGAFLKDCAKNFVIGGAMFPFWYMPILLVLYLATPLIVLGMRARLPKAVWLVLALLPLGFSRTWPEVSISNYVYFLGAYTIGIWIGRNYQQWMQCVAPLRWWILLGILAISAGLYMLFIIDFDRWWLISTRESLFYIQKLLISALVLSLFVSHLQTTPKWLNLLADYAFPIFFIHNGLLFVQYRIVSAVFGHYPLDSTALIFAFITLGTNLIACVLIAKLFQRLLGRHSRKVIGR